MTVAWFRAAAPDPADPLDATAPVIAALRRRHVVDLVTAAEAHDFVWRHFRQPYDVCVYEPGASPAHAFMRAYQPHFPGPVAPLGLGTDGLPPMAAATPAPTPAAAPAGPLTLALLPTARAPLVERAIGRARHAGADAVLLRGAGPAQLLRDAAVVLALDWPPAATPPHAALLGMAAGKPVVVLEVESTAGWPALDPQTWRPRGYLPDPPVVVSLEPRDEEHSLALAIARLAADAPLRARLGAAAHAWWQAHATLRHALAAWETLLHDAATRRPPPRGADGTAAVRAQLAPFGVTVDFLG